jgi:hypothetical protein
VSTERLDALDRAVSTFVDDFGRPTLDRTRWIDHYLPHWTTPDRSRAHYDLDGRGLRLRIDADQSDWRPEDAPLRVSNLQTATFSGPLGSARGTHRHRRDGLQVRTETPLELLWAPRSGQVDIAVTASRDPGCMLAAWLVGTEHLDEQDSGEVCLFEIDADAITQEVTRARTGVKAHHDPRLVTEMVEVEVPVRAGQRHIWSAKWGREGVQVACQGIVVFTSTQMLDYPAQLMVDLFEFGPRDGGQSYPKTARVHEVVGLTA